MDSRHQKTVVLRIIGYGTSLFFTLAAYFVMVQPDFFHLKVSKALMAIFVLAICQAAAQFIFFIDVWREEGPRWNLGLFISTVLLILTIVFFSIWVMDHMNYNMMP